jgi:CRP-like cAMP-binding protein
MIDTKILGALELFEGLPERGLAAVAAIAEERRYAPGGIIFSPELSSDWAFLLLAGAVRLTVHASSLPEPMTVAVLETPGQAFGFSTVIGQQQGPRGRLHRHAAGGQGPQPPAGDAAAGPSRHRRRLRDPVQHHSRELKEDP